MQKRNNYSKRKSIWIVDYDLEDKPCRRQFYREIEKLMGKTGLSDASSSYSVVTVKNEKTARALHDLAGRCGRAHLYQARQVDVQSRKD